MRTVAFCPCHRPIIHGIDFHSKLKILLIVVKMPATFGNFTIPNILNTATILFATLLIVKLKLSVINNDPTLLFSEFLMIMPSYIQLLQMAIP